MEGLRGDGGGSSDMELFVQDPMDTIRSSRAWIDKAASIPMVVKNKRTLDQVEQYQELPAVVAEPLPALSERFSSWWEVQRPSGSGRYGQKGSFLYYIVNTFKGFAIIAGIIAGIMCAIYGGYWAMMNLSFPALCGVGFALLFTFIVIGRWKGWFDDM
jgi:hypothetical protein